MGEMDMAEREMEREAAEEFYLNAPCCHKPSLQNFPHKVAGNKYTNRLCLKCKTHWYGPVGEETRYTAAEWEDWMHNAEIRGGEAVPLD